MKVIRLRAYAKINLYLDVLGRRPDGYHDIETVFQSIDLCDELEIRCQGEGVRIRCDHPGVPLDATNIAIKAARAMSERAGIDQGIEIIIEKRIPVAAGLAGGSADAAAVLVGLNELWQLGYSLETLMGIGVQIGADVPFCLLGGTALGRGIGEQLQPLTTAVGMPLVIANPGFSISTAWAFQRLKFGLTKPRKNVTILVRHLQEKCWHQAAQSIYNVFEPIAISHHPLLGDLLEYLRQSGAFAASLTGTGPTVFGIMPDEMTAQRTQGHLDVPFSVVSRSCGQGVEIL